MPSLFEQIIPRRKLLLIASETVIISGLLFFGTSLPPLSTQEFDFGWSDPETLRGLLSCFTIAMLCQASLSYNDLYDWKVSQNRAELPNRLVHSAGYALVMLAILVYVLPQVFHFPGLSDVSGETWKLILLLALSFTAVYAWRQGFHWFFYKWNFAERVLVLGTGQRAISIATLIQDHPMSGFECIGLIGPGESEGDKPLHLQIVGAPDDLARIARDRGVSRVVSALEERRGQTSVSELLQCRMDGLAVEERETMYERIAGKIAVEGLRPSYLIFGGGFVKKRLPLLAKRCIDLTGAILGLILSSPLCLVTVILIKLDSKGPILFRQARVGQDGRVFSVLKFRTMRTDAESETGPVWAQTNDSRVTRVGRWLRPTRVDEIPQMFNVLAGQMSFVGPRPERPFFIQELAQANPFYTLRHSVRPGITGWAQVNHPYGASVEDGLEKLRYDLYYIKNMSPLFDLNIILRTVGVILFGKGGR